jgi:ligand-binding sensor domain-containing protein
VEYDEELPIFRFMRRLIFLFFLMAGIDAYGQIKTYPFSKLDIQDGLSDNHINTIFKDRRGYLWYGTRVGLNRYDGYAFKVFRHDDSDPASLTDDNVQGIFEGPDDKLYISGATGGIDMYDPLTERFVPHTDDYFKTHHLSRLRILGIVRGKDNYYYFIYKDSGVYRFEHDKAAIRLGPDTGGTSTARSWVEDAALDSSGGLWLSYGNGMMECMDLSTGRITLRTTVLQQTKPQAQYGYKLFR